MKSLLAIALMLAGAFVVAGCDNDDPAAPCDDPTVDFTIYCPNYLNHRFFMLDLPVIEPEGRESGDHILSTTIKIFQLRLVLQPSPGDILNVATYVDSLGLLAWDDLDFGNPYLFGRVWREVNDWVPMRDAEGQFVAVDLGKEMGFGDVLAVIYEVQRADGSLVRVGDHPGIDVPQQEVSGGEGFYYRMKLLKARVWDREPNTFGYILRNIYSLGSTNIEPDGFSLCINRFPPGITTPWQDENGVDYVRIFGLDRDNPDRTGFADGQVDVWDPYLFNLDKGLLTFPLDFPRPFAPGGNPIGRPVEADIMAEAVYTAYADTTAFVWNPSFLRENQSWEIYDPANIPWDYSRYGSFRIIATYARPEEEDP